MLSQRASGWTVLPERYDDGGFSGASLERPALKELLNKIEARAIDCVVVQETVLLLPRRMSGPESVSEKQLRAIARQVDWTSQRKLFDGLMSQQSR